jgi:hypothetical protein
MAAVKAAIEKCELCLASVSPPDDIGQSSLYPGPRRVDTIADGYDAEVKVLFTPDQWAASRWIGCWRICQHPRRAVSPAHFSASPLAAESRP